MSEDIRELISQIETYFVDSSEGDYAEQVANENFGTIRQILFEFAYRIDVLEKLIAKGEESND